MKKSEQHLSHYFFFLHVLVCIIYFSSCNNNSPVTEIKPSAKTDTTGLTEEQKHFPENALKGLTVAEGLEVHPKELLNIDFD